MLSMDIPEHAYVWDDQDRLIAICRQTVTVFA
jgi:YD repeat-containing protein